MDKKTKKQRQIAFESLPPAIRENFSLEEKDAFLNSEEWPDELFKKLDEFIIKE